MMNCCYNLALNEHFALVVYLNVRALVLFLSILCLYPESDFAGNSLFEMSDLCSLKYIKIQRLMPLNTIIFNTNTYNLAFGMQHISYCEFNI